MIEQISRRISGYLVEHGADPDQKEVYAYSMECILNLLISDILLYSIGILVHQLPALLVWSISYSLLRVNIGGYHASTHARCITAGTIVGLISLPMNRLWFAVPGMVTALFILILIDIILFAPVPHVRRPVSEQGKKKAKIRAFIITISGFLLVFLLQYKNLQFGKAILSGFACALILALIASAFNAKKGEIYETQ